MDVVCLGLMVCDILVKPITKGILDADSTRVDFVKMGSGGDAFNMAISLSKIGLKTSIIGKVGDDGFGRYLKEEATKRGVDSSGISVTNQCGTSTSVVLIHPDGERSFAYYGGATDTLCKEDIDFEMIRKADFLLIGSAFALPCLDGGGLADILKKASEYGVRTVLDVTQVDSQKQIEVLRPSLKYLDIFIPSSLEAKILSGMDKPEEMAKVFLEMGVKCVVIKLGSEGCYINNGSTSCHVPPFRVEAVDCTGAGDSFVAGFIAGVIKGWELYDCGRFGNAAGAMAVQTIGANSGIIDFESIIEFMAKNS